jgi:hypothetical protein
MTLNYVFTILVPKLQRRRQPLTGKIYCMLFHDKFRMFCKYTPLSQIDPGGFPAFSRITFAIYGRLLFLIMIIFRGICSCPRGGFGWFQSKSETDLRFCGYFITSPSVHNI